MKNNDDKKAALLQPVLDHLLERGLHESGLRALAERAGTSDRMLIYYFGTKDALITAALALLAEQLTLALEPTLGRARLPPDEVEALLLAQLTQPHFTPAIALFFEVAAQAARGVSPYPAAAAALQLRLLHWIDARLDAPALTRPALARRTLTRVNGELMQRMIER